MRWLVILVSLLTAGCGTPADLDADTPRHVAMQGLVVESVPADAGFWATTRAGRRVWVALALAGRSAMPVQAGERVDITGVVVAHGRDFAARQGLTGVRDVELLTHLGTHVEVEQADVRVVPVSPRAVDRG